MRIFKLGVIAAAAAAIAACAAMPSSPGASSAASGLGAAKFQRTTLNGKACVKIPQDRIGIQLWAVQSLFNIPQGTGLNATANADAVDKGLAQVAAIGYRNVEPYSTYGLTAAQFRGLLDKNGLKAVASHATVSATNWDATLDYAVAMGQKYIGSSLPPQPGVTTIENLKQMALNVNALGERAAAKGLKLYLHNHTVEFENQYLYDINKDGKPVMTPAWQIVAAETDPRYVNFEVDVNWYYRGLQGLGRQAELTNFIKKYSDRVLLYHVKQPNAEPAPSRGELNVNGDGVIDWPAVFAAGSSVEYYIYEVDLQLMPQPADALRSAEIAYKYMTCTA